MYPAQAVVGARPSAAALASPAPRTAGTRTRGRTFAIAAVATVLLAGGGIAATLVLHDTSASSKPATPSGSDAGSGSAKSAIAKPSPPQTPAPPPFDPDQAGVTLGTPTPAPIGDFWSWPRSDGTVLVTSPLVDAVFPSQPTFEIKPGAKTKDGRDTEVYNIAVADKVHILNLQIVALGRGARDDGAVAALKEAMQKLGKVTRDTYVDHSAKSQEVTRLNAIEPATATTEDSRMIVDARIDTSRGLFVYATADTVPSYNAIGDAFLEHVHLRTPGDATTDSFTLTGVRLRKPHKLFEAHDKGDSFVVELPWMAKVERTVDSKNNVVHVAITASKGKSTIAVDVEEKAAWDALGITPKVVDGLKADDQKWAATQKHVVTQLTWNPFQHRLYRVTCTATPCEAVIKSLRFAAPEPTK
ncbi:MAG TPA: hypothetical protein VH143_02330 [Kofleriaceae bacterium]|nr:hypothetical protein [Kofleriaceae bacterium]